MTLLLEEKTFLFLPLLIESNFWFASSVTRLGDLLDFGQLFKAFGNK